jgi:hypothetical protein
MPQPSEAPEGVTIVEATGYAGSKPGPVGPLIELAMAQAIADCNALGIADDTPNEKLAAIVGAPTLELMFGEDAGTVKGGEYIREMKLAARSDVKEKMRALLTLHEQAEAAKLHDARPAE